MATVNVSERAAEMLRRVKAERAGVLTITIDGGCCEGTAPHLYEDYVLPYGAHPIGEAEGITVYVPASFEDDYETRTVTVDLVEDAGSDALSLETEHGVRLVLRHR